MDEYHRKKLLKLIRQHLKEMGVSCNAHNQEKWAKAVSGRLKQKLEQNHPPQFEKAAWQALYETSYFLGYQAIVEANVAHHAGETRAAIAKQFLRQVAGNDESLIEDAQVVLDQAVDKLIKQMAPNGQMVVHYDNLKGYLWTIAIRKWGEVYNKSQKFNKYKEEVSQDPESFCQNPDPTAEFDYQQAVKQLLQIMALFLTPRCYSVFAYMLHNPDYTDDEIAQHFNIKDDNLRQIKRRIREEIRQQFGNQATRTSILTTLFGYKQGIP